MLRITSCARFLAACVLTAFLAAVSQAQTPVSITNPADVAKAQGIQTPFAFGLTCSNTYPNSICEATAHVPANVRWVIKNFSLACYHPSSTQVTLLYIQTSAGGAVTEILPNLTADRFMSASSNPRSVMQMSQSIESYADPGSLIVLNADLSTVVPASQFVCSLNLQGQVSRAGESRPRALPEPYVSLSAHTAPGVRPLPIQKLPVSEQIRY